MSEALRDVAEPWVNALGSDPPMEVLTTVYQFAAEIWNATRPSERRVETQRIAEITDLLERSLPELSRQAVHDLMTQMQGVAVFRYGEDDRRVVDVSVERSGPGRFNIVAASVS